MWNKIKHLFIKPKNGLCGCNPSPKDDRDYIKEINERWNLSSLQNNKEIDITSFDLSDKMGNILNQGDTNSCTGHAATYLMNILLSRTLGKSSDYKINPFFNYYWARYYSNLDTDSDLGAYIRGALSGLVHKGIWSCNMNSPYQTPPEDYKEEDTFKLKGYERVDQGSNSLTEDLISILFGEKLPLYCCVKIVDRFVDSWTGKIRNTDFDHTGGWHAMTVVGFKLDNDNDVWFKTANSWGKSWGDNGFAWIHEDYFKDIALVSEIWCPIKSYY